MIDGDYGFIGNKIDNSSYSAINSGVKNRIFRAGDSSFINNVECSIIIDGDGDTIRTGADYSFAFGKNVVVNNSYEADFYSSAHPGVVKITDVLLLTPRTGPPSTPVKGMILIPRYTVN